MKKLVLLIILIGVMLVFQPETAFATENYSLESWCAANGGSWSGSECALTSTVVIMPGESLTIAANETLTIGMLGKIYNYGIVSNYGTFRNTYTIYNHGTIDNYGSFYNSSLPSSLADFNEIDSQSENSGGAILFNYGTFTNYCPGSYSGSLPYGYPIEESCEDTVIGVVIDIKPDSDQNSINCRASNAVIPVAILTTGSFDATLVDHTTVFFESASETHVNKDGEPKRHEEDVDGDGDIDLMFHFRWGDTGLDCSSTEVTLTGETFEAFGGLSIEGTDSITTVPRR